MLYVKIVHSPDDKSLLFDQLNTGECCWVVNDLESKFWMQKKLRHGLNKPLASDRVLRASELWQKLLLKNQPQWLPLSPHLSQFLIEKWMSEIIDLHQINISNKDRQKAYKTIAQILPLLSHFQGEDVMEEWFSERGEAKERWFEWYELGRHLWSRFAERKIVPQEWMKGFLLNQDLPRVGDDAFVFDLGLDMDDVESELIVNLARDHQVTVIVPAQERERDHYESLVARAQVEELPLEDFPVLRQFKRFPSMLSEVKEATAVVRQWLDEGVPAEKIAVLSPQIENYWSTLYQYMKVEGIPCQKAVATPLSQLNVYQNWLSKIRLALKKVQSADGENVFFDSEQVPVLSFSQFQKQFTNVYDISDYEKNENIKELMPQKIESYEEFSFDEFIQWSFSFVDSRNLDEFARLMQDFDDVYSINEKLKVSQWLEFFENYFSRTEKKIQPASEDGLHILPLQASENSRFEKIVVLGLTEKNLIESQDTALHWTDIESIKMNFGFNLPHADRMVMLQRVQWLDRKKASQIVYCLSETDFSGQFQAPSLFWLQGAMEHDFAMDLSSPQRTRWDEIMLSDPEELIQGNKDMAERRLKAVERDQGIQPYEKLQNFSMSLSASTIEDFFKCPFKWHARKNLKLDSLPSLDLDIDRMTRGQLMHKVCEIIVSQKTFNYTQAQLEDLVEQAKKSTEMEVYSDAVWKFLKPVYVSMAQSFVEFEEQWRNKHPESQAWGLECAIKGRVAVQNDSFSFVPSGGIPFRGVIDRVDHNGKGEFALVDYKSSNGSIRQEGSWLKNGTLQLLLYCLALEDGVLGGESKEVVSAIYFGLKEMQRDKGFTTSDADPSFVDPKKAFSKSKRVELYQQARQLFAELVANMSEGLIEAVPRESTTCDKCDWKKICRNPQLNL